MRWKNGIMSFNRMVTGSKAEVNNEKKTRETEGAKERENQDI